MTNTDNHELIEILEINPVECILPTDLLYVSQPLDVSNIGEWEGCQVNKFEYVSSLGHQTTLTGEHHYMSRHEY